MAKYILDNSYISEYLDVSCEFTDIYEFCEFLLKNEKDTNIKLGIKKMVIQKILADDKDEKNKAHKRLFKETVAWIKENCAFDMGEEPAVLTDTREADAPDEPIRQVIPQSDFEKAKYDYETSEFQKVQPLEDDDLDYTAIELREGGIITLQDNVQLILSKSGISLELSKMLFVAEEGNKVLAMGYLVPDEKNTKAYSIVLSDKKCIDYKSFEAVNRARIVVYTKDGKIFSRLVELEYKPFDVSDRPLCIDFGTSNTSAGSYGIRDVKKDEAEIVRFIDVTVTPNNTDAVLLPTIVYIDDCSDPDHIKYLFGYEAKKRIEEEHYESKASVYYEIKRWMPSADEEEEIRDNNNKKAYPTKGDIIKAYLDYVIEASEQYFGTRFDEIHFSAPVKLKEQFIHTFTKMYQGEKKITSVEDSIDEGIAIVYNKIIELIYPEDKEREPVNNKSIMIMDCGGGTTDLASCSYEFKKTGIGTELRLDTCFENGNSNFGGNNITYRIMQLLKIKIAARMKEGLIEGEGNAASLIDKSENDILGLIEEQMESGKYDSDDANRDIYGKFLDNYARAEEVVPTQFVDNQIYRGDVSLKKIKRNFHYLWRQAERVKIEFYKKNEKVTMDEEDTFISMDSKDNYYLYISDNGELKKMMNPFVNVEVTIREINLVICGDIYSLLVGLFQKGELKSVKQNVDSFDYYKLSGQSCKISLFSELIKEYVPGRKLRPAPGVSTKHADNGGSEALKLDCVRGCINYIKDQRRSEMRVIPNPKNPEIIYDVMIKGNHEIAGKIFDCNTPNKVLIDVSHSNTKEYKFVVQGRDGVQEREFEFKLYEPDEKDKYVTTDDIRKKIFNNLEQQTIVDEEGAEAFVHSLEEAVSGKDGVINILFAVPSKLGYGVYIGQIQAESTVDGEKYKFLKYRYENFEDTSKTFFDGRR